MASTIREVAARAGLSVGTVSKFIFLYNNEVAFHDLITFI